MFTLKHPAALSELPRILEGQVLVKVEAARLDGVGKAKLRLVFESATVELEVPLKACSIETDYIMPQVLEAGGEYLTEVGVV